MRAIACALWLICGAYGASFAYRGWVPHDEGTIGQSAERVLSGELPHRDFDEVYTGGLTYLHAAGMKLFGVNLRAPRLVLLAFFMAFLGATYGIARRIASTTAALIAMPLATVWSVPNYFVSLPSWYNLFFAAFGVLALLHFLETRRRGWLVLAGFFGGLSVLAKIAGLFYLAAGFLTLMYVEQTDAIAAPHDQKSRSRWWPVAAIPAVVLVLILIGLSISKAASADVMQLFVPALLVCGFVLWHERAAALGAFSMRARNLASLALPFAAGAAIPITAFVLLFWRQHALMDLIRGVFVLPQRRLTEASMSPPAAALLGLAVPYGALLLADWRRPVPRQTTIALAVAAVLGGVLALGTSPAVYRSAWVAARALTIVATIAGIWLLEMAPAGGAFSSTKRPQVFLLVAMSAFVSLVQFPYATPTYFCYAAPLTGLAIIAIVFAQPHAPKRIHLAVAAFFCLFAVLFVNRSYGWNLGVKFIRYQPSALLSLDRGGLRVPDEDKRTYEALVKIIRQHAAGGTIYAGPDCPEVYFLSATHNPTRTIFDFLTPVEENEEWANGLLARHPIRAAVINTAPLFSRRLDPAAQAVFERRFPSSVSIGRFIVRFEP